MRTPAALWRDIAARKLVQWAAAYLAAAWLVLQALDILGNHFGWAPLVFRAGFVVLCAGLLATVILAWYHGDRGRQRVSGAELLLLGVVMLVTAGALTLARPHPSTGGEVAGPRVGAPERGSLAVLPFSNVGGDSAQEYFSDGLSEELMVSLAQVPGLRVAARSSCFYFKGRDLPVEDVARRLRVARVVEGSVRRSGDSVRVMVQLVDASSGATLWSGAYNRRLREILAVEEALAREIVQALSLHVAASPAPRTSNPAALDHYLRGQHLLRIPDRETLRQAIREYEAAIALDSSYAAPYAGVALASDYLVFFSLEPPGAMFPLAAAAARRSLARDSMSSEALTALGQVERWWRHDRPAAERAFARAVEVDPRNPQAHQAYAWFLLDEGRMQAALTESRRSWELDPFSAWESFLYGRVLLLAGEDEAAGRQADLTLALDSTYHPAWRLKAEVLMARRQAAEAGELLQRHPRPDDSFDMSDLGDAYARVGRRREALAVVARLEAQYKREWVHPGAIARVYAGLGDLPRALDWLEEAERRGALWPELNALPEYKMLHGQPRFQRLLRGLGLRAGG